MANRFLFSTHALAVQGIFGEEKKIESGIAYSRSMG
jgi:hypothetical protein